MQFVRGEPPPQDAVVSPTLRRFTERRRELLNQEQLEEAVRVGRDLTTVLARIATALERRTG